MSTLTMVRTVCCDGYQTCGKRCSLCPHRPENQAAIEAYKAAVRTFSSRGGGASGTAADPDSTLLASAQPAWMLSAGKS